MLPTGHTVPHVPQLLLSEASDAHTPLQSDCPAAQLAEPVTVPPAPREPSGRVVALSDEQLKANRLSAARAARSVRSLRIEDLPEILRFWTDLRP